MAKTSLDPSKFFLGNEEYQKNFLHNCRLWFEEILRQQCRHVFRQNPYPNAEGVRCLELLHVQYRRGVLRGWLSSSYDAFEHYVLSKPDEPHQRPHIPYRWRRRNIYGPYRVGTKYRKNPEHKPKEGKSEKQLWREHKGFDKDKRGLHWTNGCRSRIFWKNKQNRQRRREVARLLHLEEYEQIHDQPNDRWRWS